MLKSEISIVGEFTSLELEKNYQLENIKQNRQRMMAICFVTSICYFFGIIINFLDLGLSWEFWVLFLLRLITLILGFYAGFLAWNESLNKYFNPVMIVYMSMLGLSESIEAVLEYNSGVGLIIPVSIIIVLMYYLFIPVSYLIALIPSIFLTFSYILCLVFFTNAQISYIINLVILFIIANVYGFFHLITFNRIRRKEFYALREQKRLNFELQKEINNRQEIEQKLRELATKDNLTGVYNRRHFMEVFEQEIKGVNRYKNNLSLMMLDIDYFKYVNDTYGHLVGDIALKHLAEIIEKNLREIDILARFGGEEFIILLPNTNLNNAYNIAERIRKILAQTPINISETSFTITISIGISTFSDTCNTISTMIKIADEALYQAKENGRNQTILMLQIRHL